MKRNLILILLSIVIACGSAFAQKKPTQQERAQWMNEIRNYKIEFLAKELALTDDQRAKFTTLYTAMDKELDKVQWETRQMEHKIGKNGDKTTDLEYEKAAEAMFELKGREAKIESEYFKKFKTVLTPKQLYILKSAERKFTRALMDHHGKRKHNNKDKKNK